MTKHTNGNNFSMFLLIVSINNFKKSADEINLKEFLN